LTTLAIQISDKCLLYEGWSWFEDLLRAPSCNPAVAMCVTEKRMQVRQFINHHSTFFADNLEWVINRQTP